MEQENKTMRELVGEYATYDFKNGLNCCECVYDALLRAGALEGVDKETLSMCVGFGGGIGMTGHVCGALSGAVLANGAVYGRKDPWAVPDEERGGEIAKKYYRRYNNMAHKFTEIAGSCLCREICADYLGDWGAKTRRLNCMRIIAETAQMAYDYLQMGPDEAAQLPYGYNVGGLK